MVKYETPPEPAGTRMTMVKGFSGLTYHFLGPNLPPPLERRDITCHWPVWLGECRRCAYHLGGELDPGGPVGVPLAELRVWPDGRLKMFLYNWVRGGQSGEYEARFAGPVDGWADGVVAGFGERLVEHLTAATGKAAADTVVKDDRAATAGGPEPG